MAPSEHTAPGLPTIVRWTGTAIGSMALAAWTGYGALLWLVACGIGVEPVRFEPFPSGMAACAVSTAVLLVLAARVRPKDLGARIIQIVFFCYFWTGSGAAFLLAR